MVRAGKLHNRSVFFHRFKLAFQIIGERNVSQESMCHLEEQVGDLASYSAAGIDVAFRLAGKDFTLNE